MKGEKNFDRSKLVTQETALDDREEAHHKTHIHPPHSEEVVSLVDFSTVPKNSNMKCNRTKILLALSAVTNLRDVADAQVAVPGNYVGGFRLRLHWEKGFNWQESSKERFWCMECTNSCNSGDKIRE